MVEVFIQGKRKREYPACLHFCEVKLNSGELRSYGPLASLTVACSRRSDSGARVKNKVSERAGKK